MKCQQGLTWDDIQAMLWSKNVDLQFDILFEQKRKLYVDTYS